MRDPFSLLHHSPIYPQYKQTSYSLYNSISSAIPWSMQVLSRRFSTLYSFSLLSIIFLLPSYAVNFACILRTLVFCFCFFRIRILRLRVFFALYFCFIFGRQIWISKPFAPAFFYPNFIVFFSCFVVLNFSSLLQTSSCFYFFFFFSNVRFVQWRFVQWRLCAEEPRLILFAVTLVYL